MIDYGYGIALDTIDNAPRAREWRNKREVYDNCRQVGLIDEARHGRWLQSIGGSDRDHMFAVICEHGHDAFNTVMGSESNPKLKYVVIGVAGLTGINRDHGTAEISLYCDADTVKLLKLPGRMAPRIIKTLACYAFLDLRLNRIFGDTFATNTVELANLDECGFVREGTLRQSYWKNGRFIDSVMHSMLRSEFEERRKEW